MKKQNQWQIGNWAPSIFLALVAISVLDESRECFLAFAFAAFLLSPSSALLEKPFSEKLRPKARHARFFVALLLFLWGAALLPITPNETVTPEGSADEAANPFDGKTLFPVVSVADGDTITVLVNGQKESVRMIGIDAPEANTARTGSVECYGAEAEAFAKKLFNGQKAALLVDATQDARDMYGRLLAHVFLPNGSNYQEQALRQGYALYYLYEKPSAYDAEYRRAEEQAKAENRGLWKECDGRRQPATITPLLPPARPPSGS